MSLAHGSSIVKDGLVLHLDAANVKSYPGSGSTWFDLSGNANNASLINSPSFNSSNGGSIVFDGVNQKGTFNTPISSSSNQTYEIWTNAIASASTDGYAYILHNNAVDTSTGNSYLTIGIKPTQEYYAAFNGAYATMSSGVTANNSNIVNIVLSWDGLTQRFYINGELKDSESLGATPLNFSNITSFGDDKSTTTRMIQGKIYLIKVYSKALSDVEIKQNFNALRGRYGV